ncbi:Transcriptional regulator containing PAS, AAA-type ATPase, and DNA-binding Fis domains [Anaerosphaera aminiphila DSM 21120]|uniref:Transcriptional regulator containing PAS, AAA-type ATPase, and DNA-binding Fis domains n=1 Tax=Anaerosphaera aminiphila DSM 21120 TaxID=1120995 RepID=A0A1M5QTG5_9FIRM|nr:sigma 54-interacting transcriptional regulator [Anaerosphaera aminiphila]SHH17166.1 Transcriptional regulator containing PAS, AAA-type ATPase, and DNA-binding Fis domains [Anaerosphaera aminiphila DSM 21120]
MHRYDLTKISDEIQDYAEAVSKIANAEVEVVDVDLRRIAGTGYYKDKIGRDMSSKGYVYKHVIESKNLAVITNPGENELCLNCPDADNCVETFEVSTPILLDDEVIGVLGLIGLNDLSRELLDKNLDNYLDFINQITNFISTMMINYYREEDTASYMEALKTTVSYLSEAVLVLDIDDKIRISNKSAESQLGLDENCQGMKINHSPAGDKVAADGSEYYIDVNGHRKYVVGNILGMENPKLNKILIFDGIKKVKSDLYDLTSTFDTGSIIGSSKETKQLLDQIKLISNSNSTILITGESGTGKELIATSIWKSGDRANNRFISINCAAIPETLLESELFGYTKGAFTGADSRGKIGKFELANSGIIFLDEIGDMPIHLQSKILRVLENRVVTRLGSNKEIPLNVKVIAATNKDLTKMIRDGKFREDLYYRLNVIPIEALPLRKRKEDIIDLTQFFIKRYSNLFNKKYVKMEPGVLDTLMDYWWPGNVRELENAVEFMINMMGPDGILTKETLPKDFALSRNDGKIDSNIRTLAELEKMEINKALNKYGRSTDGKKRIAETLNIGVATLYRKMKQYEIE